ncbi:MAG: type 1 glutamine amidotransferase family protein [Vagococcus sp.]|uniref:type 1 glutamine amidotransferase family protein n=1 Tax=Vagococcus sp. TaxID=1933889 RepID=UPI002FC84B5C
MKTAIFFLLDEYADWEGAYLSSTLNKSTDWTVKTASIQKEVTSIGGFKTKVDLLLGELPEKIDLFILIGSNSWNLTNDTLSNSINHYLNQNITVGAICGAVDYLARNCLLSHYKHTGNSQFLWTDFANYSNPEDFVEQLAYSDRNLITANGTGPIEFTELVLKAIRFDTDEAIEKTIYMNQHGFYKYCDKYGNPFF